MGRAPGNDAHGNPDYAFDAARITLLDMANTANLTYEARKLEELLQKEREEERVRKAAAPGPGRVVPTWRCFKVAGASEHSRARTSSRDAASPLADAIEEATDNIRGLLAAPGTRRSRR